MKINLFLFLLLFVSPVFAQDLAFEKGVMPHKGLDAVYRQFSEGYRKLDAAMVANLYTESAAYLAPGNEIQVGRGKILENFRSFFDSVKKQNDKLEIKFRIVQRQIDKNLAYDVGIYTLISTNEKGESSSGGGKFVVVGKQEKDGVWRFQVDGYSDLPNPKPEQMSKIPDICSAYPEQKSSPYILPFEAGKSFEVWRTVEHYTPGNGGVGVYAIDFKMPVGTTILAAREGEVVAARGEFFDGNGEDLKENFVFIRHSDGTIGRYFHLTRNGALVKVGDKVKQGQPIGLSGNTGQSAGPHLHFDVQKCGPNLPPNYNQMPCGQTVPVTFRNTEEYSCNLKSGKTYQALDFTPNLEKSSLEAEKEVIKQTALDYIEGWYDGNAERMERALHPDLAKRIVHTNEKGQSRLDQMSALGLIQGVRAGYGKNTPKDKQQKDVTILDVYENAASVKIVASDWIDYLHIAKSNGRWVIVNVLWELKPPKK